MTHRAQEIFQEFAEEFDRKEAAAKTLTDGIPWRKNPFVILKLRKTAKLMAKNEIRGKDIYRVRAKSIMESPVIQKGIRKIIDRCGKEMKP